MHLSKELQKHLELLESPVKLASSIDGTLPDRYAFNNRQIRNFRAEFASTNNEFSIVLFETTSELNYENCFARGLFYDIVRFATVIDWWIGKHKDIIETKKHFAELELFEDFHFKNPNNEIDKAWRKVKNRFFNDTQFWKFSEWTDRYIELLSEAKKHKSFQNYFPFTSHDWLRFSIDKYLNETWTLKYYIIPTIYSEEIATTARRFYVSYNDKPMGGQFFDSAIEALDFYAEKLKQTKRI